MACTKQSTDQTNALLSEIFLFLVRAACKLRLASYGPKHTSQWFSFMPFVHNYTYNSKTNGRIKMFYLLNDCSTVEDIYSLSYSYMQDMISELWHQICIAITFQHDILCTFTFITQKLQVIRRHSTYPMTALLSEMSIFCIRAGCKIRMASYASKHSWQSSSETPFFVYTVYLDT